MDVATVSAEGKPSSRIVLIKQFDERGFTWYTNYHSDKGRQLEHNPHAALLFFWRELERQVRIEGTVVKPRRPRATSISMCVPAKPARPRLPRSRARPSPAASAGKQLRGVAAAIGDAQPPRPAHWGGYRLQPERIEFWQGRRSRFHDRIVYARCRRAMEHATPATMNSRRKAAVPIGVGYEGRSTK
jgi:pyridoxamine 5'-phosphate oxidase